MPLSHADRYFLPFYDECYITYRGRSFHTHRTLNGVCGVEAQLRHFLASVPDTDRILASCSGSLIPGERTLSIHWTRDWLGSRHVWKRWPKNLHPTPTPTPSPGNKPLYSGRAAPNEVTIPTELSGPLNCHIILL